MKKHTLRIALFLFINGISFHLLLAQDWKPDVIYLKDGSIYKGTITHQTPNVRYEIETADGIFIPVANKNIDSLVLGVKHPIPAFDTTIVYYTNAPRPGRKLPSYGYKDHGYFFQAQINIQYAGGGARIINGYKINQYAILGLGIGFGGAALAANTPSNLGGAKNPFSGSYFPFFLYYSGDILKKKITPFYAIEIGYGVSAPALIEGNSYYGPVHVLTGGPMGSGGFGVRFYSGRRFVFSLSANLDIQQAHTDVTNEQSYYNHYPEFVSKSMTMLLPAFKIGIGFVK
jgi:hypothetical protein